MQIYKTVGNRDWGSRKRGVLAVAQSVSLNRYWQLSIEVTFSSRICFRKGRFWSKRPRHKNEITAQITSLLYTVTLYAFTTGKSVDEVTYSKPWRNRMM